MFQKVKIEYWHTSKYRGGFCLPPSVILMKPSTNIFFWKSCDDWDFFSCDERTNRLTIQSWCADGSSSSSTDMVLLQRLGVLKKKQARKWSVNWLFCGILLEHFSYIFQNYNFLLFSFLSWFLVFIRYLPFSRISWAFGKLLAEWTVSCCSEQRQQDHSDIPPEKRTINSQL